MTYIAQCAVSLLNRCLSMIIVVAMVTAVFSGDNYGAEACSEAVCASIGSKCMLTGSCNCDMTDLGNCSCCKECALCLDSLYEECCYCFQMCPKPVRSWLDLSLHSEVEEYSDPLPQLFSTLTESSDPQERWSTFTFPVDHHIGGASNGGRSKTKTPKYKVKLIPLDDQGREILISGGGEGTTVTSADHQLTLNCTVAFLSQCRSWVKCHSACRSMGASAVRWFHSGCCQCVGDTCLNFGISESRCVRCSQNEMDNFGDAEMDMALAIAFNDINKHRNHDNVADSSAI